MASTHIYKFEHTFSGKGTIRVAAKMLLIGGASPSSELLLLLTSGGAFGSSEVGLFATT